MKIILCRLGVFTLPYFIQKRWFFQNNQQDLFAVSCKEKSLKEEERRKFKIDSCCYLTGYYHYYKEKKPDDHYCNYEYFNNEELSFFQRHEKKYCHANNLFTRDEIKNISWYSKMKSFMDRSIYIDRSNRTNPILIEIVEEYNREVIPEKDSWGTHCAKVVEIPDDIEWEIDQPEGCNEIVREKHRIWGMNGRIK